jgi:hypothetical protein
MRYLYEKIATYNNIKVLCGNIKPIFYFSKIPRAKKYLTRIRLITAHVTLTHATLNNRKTAKFGKRKASCGDRLTSSLENYSVEKNVKSKVFVNKTNKKG